MEGGREGEGEEEILGYSSSKIFSFACEILKSMTRRMLAELALKP